jgi:predicted dienelactone hydrolase
VSETRSTVNAVPVLSVAPVVLPAPGRAVDMQLRVSLPLTGGELPVILLSHGHGSSNHLSSLNGYGPLANFWAARGFVVIQPTHLDSKTLSLGPDDVEAPLYWRTRAKDMSFILDHLDLIEADVPWLRDRMDRRKVAIVGHSLGGQTASLLLGARVTDPQDGTEVNLVDPRIKAGVLLAAPGRGGDALSAFPAEHYPFFSTTDFTAMTAPALVVAGDDDPSPHLTVRGPEWHTDPYLLAPGPKSLLTLFDAKHSLGGVSGYDVAETTDENPQRVEAVQWLTLAYLSTQFDLDETAWPTARTTLNTATNPLGRIESK